MRSSIDARLLAYYQRELAWLREAGGEFAQAHPKIAERLSLNEYECTDPHVERLLEGFAFLSARISQRLDDSYTELSSALLEQLYPYSIRPLPVAAIARFEPDEKEGSLAEGYLIPRNTLLYAHTEEGDTVYFNTTAAQTLFPVRVADACLLDANQTQAFIDEPAARCALKLTLECLAPHTWEALPIKSLRLHLSGSPVTSAVLYDMLFAHSIGDNRPRALGFDAEENLLPEEPGVDPAYALLPEYFAFPEKFLFFDLPIPAERKSSDRKLDIIIPFDSEPALRIAIGANDISTGCVPVINLFFATSDPVSIDHTRSEYLLYADARRRHATSIYRICDVRAVRQDTVIPVSPYYGIGHSEAGNGLYWHARRVFGLPPADRQSPEGDMLLTLVDARFNPATDTGDITLSAQLLCTNSAIATTLPVGTTLSFDIPGPVARVSLLRRPRSPAASRLDSESQWRLVSQLSLNHLPLGENESSLKMLKEVLALHATGSTPAVRRQIEGILGMVCKRIAGHAGTDAWRGWRNGLEVTLTLDPAHFAGSSQVLFAGVLACFFSRYVAANSFVKTILRLNDKEIPLWNLQTGNPLTL